MKEDYRKAYQERLADKNCLEQGGRRLGTMHVGGVVIECLLKAMRVEYDGIADWHVPENKCPQCAFLIDPGQPQKLTIKNPGHNLMAAITKWPQLWKRLSAMNHPQRNKFMQWISSLQKPSGNFIDLRYHHTNPNDADFRQWCEAFKRFRSWLIEQDQDLKRERR